MIVALALLLVAVLLVFNRTNNTLGRKDASFAVQDTASITRIFIADKNNNEVSLSRSSDGKWYVDGKYLAHDVKVISMLKTLKDIEVRAPVPIAGRSSVIIRMAVLAKKVEIYQITPAINIFGWIELFPREEKTKTYYVGDVTPDNQGTYMLMEGSDDPYIIYLPGLRGFVAARYSPLPNEWRDHTVFKTRFKDISSVKVEFPGEPHKSYLLESYDDHTLKLTALEDNKEVTEYDRSRLLSFLTAFTDVRFESLLNDKLESNFIDSVISSRPSAIVILKEKDGKQTFIKTFYKKGFRELYLDDGATLEPFDLDRAYALINDGEDFVLIQFFVFDRVLRPLQYFTHEDEGQAEFR